jgi:putative intracellular protease/amidase
LAKTGPLAAFGIGTPGCISPESEIGKEVLAKLVKVRPVSQMNTSEYAAIYVPGGHGCLQDINTNADLHKKISEFHAAGKILGGVCHATSTFAMVKQNGVSITSGKRLTGFPDFLDTGLIRVGLVPKQFLPLPLSNDQVLQQNGAKLSAVNQLIAVLWPKYFRVDLPFVTGTGPKAAGRVAKIMVKELAK